MSRDVNAFCERVFANAVRAPIKIAASEQSSHARSQLERDSRPSVNLCVSGTVCARSTRADRYNLILSFPRMSRSCCSFVTKS